MGWPPHRCPRRLLVRDPSPGIYKTTSLTFDEETEAEKTHPKDRGQGSLTTSPLSRNTRLFLLQSPFRVHLCLVHLCLAPLSPHPVPRGKLHPEVCPPQSSHQRVPVSTRVRPHLGLAASSVHNPPGSHLPGDKSPSHPCGPQSPARPVLSPPSLSVPLIHSAPHGPPCCSLPACQVQSCPRAFARVILPTRNDLPKTSAGFAPLLQPIPGLDITPSAKLFP